MNQLELLFGNKSIYYCIEYQNMAKPKSHQLGVKFYKTNVMSAEVVRFNRNKSDGQNRIRFIIKRKRIFLFDNENECTVAEKRLLNKVHFNNCEIVNQ